MWQVSHHLGGEHPPEPNRLGLTEGEGLAAPAGEWTLRGQYPAMVSNGPDLPHTFHPPPPPPPCHCRWHTARTGKTKKQQRQTARTCSAPPIGDTWGSATPRPLCYSSHIICGGGHPPNFTVLGMTECVTHGRCRRGAGRHKAVPRSSTQKISPVAWGKQCEQFLSKTSNRCTHRQIPTGALTPPLWQPPPPPPNHTLPAGTPQNTTECVKPEYQLANTTFNGASPPARVQTAHCASPFSEE